MDFTIGGQRLSLNKKHVERKLQGVTPGTIQRLVVEVNRVTYPVKQALSLAGGLDPADFTSHQARQVFKRLGFRVSRKP